MIFRHVLLKIPQVSFHLRCLRHPDPLQLEQNLASRKHAIRFSKNEAKGRKFPKPLILNDIFENRRLICFGKSGNHFLFFPGNIPRKWNSSSDILPSKAEKFKRFRIVRQ